MVNEWKLAVKELPPLMHNVLFVLKNGEIHKGFLNTKDLWIIQNCDDLISKYVKYSKNVIAWIKLPDANDAGWRTKEQEAPKIRSRVLIKEPMTNDVRIAYILEKLWIIRNDPDDYVTFWANMNSLWMPLPEIPNDIKVLITKG